MIKNWKRKKLRKAEYEYGFSEGKKTGFQNAAMETARRMLKSNKLSLEDIADFSGLSIDEIKTTAKTRNHEIIIIFHTESQQRSLLE